MTDMHITPRLVVTDVDQAIAFYRDAMGAELIERFEDPERGIVVHAAIRIGRSELTFAQEHREWGNHAPGSVGGTPVLLGVDTADAHALGDAMVKGGAEVIFPIEDQFYGKREGRLRDPFGHLWIVSQTLEELTAAEMQERLASF